LEIEKRLERDLESAKSAPPVVPTPIELKRLEREIQALQFRLNVLNSVSHGGINLSRIKNDYIRFADEIVPLDDHKHAVSVAEYRKEKVDPNIRRPNRRVYQQMRARQIFGMDLKVARYFDSGKATRIVEVEKGKQEVVPVSLNDLINEEDSRLEGLRGKWWRSKSRLIKPIWIEERPSQPSLDSAGSFVLTS
jgi:hypothetical protein